MEEGFLPLLKPATPIGHIAAVLGGGGVSEAAVMRTALMRPSVGVVEVKAVAHRCPEGFGGLFIQLFF